MNKGREALARLRGLVRRVDVTDIGQLPEGCNSLCVVSDCVCMETNCNGKGMESKAWREGWRRCRSWSTKRHEQSATNCFRTTKLGALAVEVGTEAGSGARKWAHPSAIGRRPEAAIGYSGRTEKVTLSVESLRGSGRPRRSRNREGQKKRQRK